VPIVAGATVSATSLTDTASTVSVPLDEITAFTIKIHHLQELLTGKDCEIAQLNRRLNHERVLNAIRAKYVKGKYIRRNIGPWSFDTSKGNSSMFIFYTGLTCMQFNILWQFL
jgi:hypothetical protein